MTLDEKIFHSWNSGHGLAQAQKSVKQHLGIDISTGAIQRKYAAIFHRFHPSKSDSGLLVISNPRRTD